MTTVSRRLRLPEDGVGVMTALRTWGIDDIDDSLDKVGKGITDLRQVRHLASGG